MHIHRWQRIIKRYLNPSEPRGLLSWRYLVPRKNSTLLLHRQAFFSGFSQRPAIFWSLMVFHSYVLWYLFYSWQQCCRNWRRYSAKLTSQKHVPQYKQLKDLLILALFYSTPPRFYYLFRLYQYPRCKWLNFVYAHELPSWHHMMSPSISPQSRRLMSDKTVFAETMSKLNLPVVSSINRVKRGDTATDAILFQGQSLFLKPVDGSRKQGCYTLLHDKQHNRYELHGKYDHFGGLDDIKATLNKQFEEKDYLIQPLLKNTHWLDSHCPCLELITIRLVTALNKNGPQCLCAVMEIPVSHHRVSLVSIDIDTGRLQPIDLSFVSLSSDNKNGGHIAKRLADKDLPDWHSLKQIAEIAHSSFSDIATIGWDFALTDEGIRLLEGNINWDVTPHQLTGEGLSPYFESLMRDSDRSKQRTGKPSLSR